MIRGEVHAVVDQPTPRPLAALACGVQRFYPDSRIAAQHHSSRIAAQQAKPSELADGPPAARPLSYFVGRWAGDFRGTQAGALLEVTAERRFTFEVSTGPEPEQRCRLLGTLAIEGDLLDLTPESPPACHSWAEAKLGKQKLLSSGERSFEIGDVEYLDAIAIDDDGKRQGPVWAFERQAP